MRALNALFKEASAHRFRTSRPDPWVLEALRFTSSYRHSAIINPAVSVTLHLASIYSNLALSASADALAPMGFPKRHDELKQAALSKMEAL